MKGKTLLEKAKENSARSTHNKNVSDEEIELCISFLKGDVTGSQTQKAVGLKSYLPGWVVRVMKAHFSRNK